MARLSSLILFCALIEFRYFSVRTSNGLIVESDLNRALYGHSFLNISRITMQDCLERCLANCLCLSFQLCGNTLVSCQLCSSNKYLKPTEIRESKSCTSFNFENPNKVSTQQCGRSCIAMINCCATSNPCFNGGTCSPFMPGRGKRFICKCPDGYGGERCRKKCSNDCDEPTTSSKSSGWWFWGRRRRSKRR